MQQISKPRLNESEFASLGGRHIAYVREMTDDEASELAEATGLPIGAAKLYALHAADGTRMAVADTIEGVRASAREHDLETVRVH
jgi:hypothetical protein